MSTPHNQAKIEDIAKTVIMPGDPLRAKYIAENFLDNYKLVNSVRCTYAYTGNYKGTQITIMAHGMGIPSIGIYSYELYNLYNVENIIRIGSCGAYIPELNLFDIILSESVFSESNYALTYNNEDCHIVNADKQLNNIIEQSAISNNIPIYKGNTICIDFFDPYMPNMEQFFKRVPENFNPLSGEMEAFALFYNAKIANKKAACLMSVVDSRFKQQIATAEERESGLNNMIKLALESAIKL